MKKIGKSILTIILGICLFIFVAVVFISISSYIRRKKVEQDLVAFSKICDATKIINEQPAIGFSGFSDKEINVLKFEIKRGKNIFFDTIIKNHFTDIAKDNTDRKINIPFSAFLKTDTIIITTANNLKFYVSDFHHSASMHYGMFGPVGGYECGLNNVFTINGATSNYISKDISFLESERQNRIKIVGAMDEAMEVISKQSKITKEMAEKIFDNHRMNKSWYSQIFCGMHIEKTAHYYVFEEEREDKNGKKDIIKINAENGNYKRYTNYPFE